MDNDPEFNRFQSDWNKTNHPEERRSIFNLAAHYCQERGQRLQVQDGKWAIAQQMRHRGSGR